MQADERLRQWTSGVVVGTAVMVGGSAILWSSFVDDSVPIGLIVTLALGTVAALALGQLAAGWSSRPELRGLEGLVRQLEEVQRGGTVGRLGEAEDEQVARVAHAVNALLERVQADWQLHQDEAALGRSALESSPNGILVAGPDGRIRYVNDSFRRLVDVRAAPEGKQPIEVVPLVEVQQAVEAVLGDQPAEELACTSGRYDLLVRPVRTSDGGAMVMVQDVTQFRMAERARTEFVANVSHELRTPMATIMGYAETLVDDREKLDPEVAMMADAIYRNARRLRDLFEDLLELSRIEARRRELPLSRERLLPLLERSVAQASDMSAKRKQELVLDCPPDLTAMLNPEALRTILDNLVRNATNYTPEGGRIRVRAQRAGREVLVEVTDNGLGIDRVHHERIFERFYRVDEGRSRRVGGTGLGLAIVKHLALASGCRVGLQSEMGKGSTFSVHLPAEVSPAGS